MTERPSDLTSGDPLAGGAAEPPRHESGLPAPERPQTLPGYGSPPPPGAGGPIAPAAYGGVMGRYVLATWLSRVGAQVIDGVIVTAFSLVLLLPSAAALGIGLLWDSDLSVGAAIGGLVLWVFCIAIIVLFYAPVLMARTNGKTLGRMAMNIRVVRTSGQPISFGFAMLREVLVKAILVSFVGTFTFGLAGLIDSLWPLWDEENRALHDFVVSTRVVQD